jgi:hypothetical protein
MSWSRTSAFPGTIDEAPRIIGRRRRGGAQGLPTPADTLRISVDGVRTRSGAGHSGADRVGRSVGAPERGQSYSVRSQRLRTPLRAPSGLLRVWRSDQRPHGRRNARSRWRCESRHADFGAASEGRNQAAQWSVSLSTSQLSAVENNLSRREVAISDLRATNCGRKHGVGLMRVFSGACPGVRVCQRCDGSQSPVVVLSLARVSADRVIPGRRAG